MKPWIYIGREPEITNDILKQFEISYQKMWATFFITLNTQEKVDSILSLNVHLMYYSSYDAWVRQYPGII